MPRIDHVAVESPDPGRVAAFYEGSSGQGGDRIRGAGSRDRGRARLRRSGRPTARGDYLWRRRDIAAHPVEQEVVEAVGQLIGIALGPQPGVRPVRGGERKQRRGAIVEIRTQRTELAAFAKECAEALLVAPAFREELLAALPLEIAPFADEDRRDVQLLRDDS